MEPKMNNKRLAELLDDDCLLHDEVSELGDEIVRLKELNKKRDKLWPELVEIAKAHRKFADSSIILFKNIVSVRLELDDLLARVKEVT